MNFLYSNDLLDFEPSRTDHLSVTQLKMFLRCPLQYEFRYMNGLKIPPAGAMTLGKSIHSTLEANYRQKIKSKEDLPLENWLDTFSDKWEKSVPETRFERDEKPGEIKDEGIILIQTYFSEIAPKIQPESVEKGFLIGVDNLKYPLLGYIDLVDNDGYIIDHKVMKRTPQKGSVDSDLQLTAYALAYRQQTGKDEKGLRFDVMVRTKTPKVEQLPTTRTQEDIGRLKRLLNYVNKAIETGIFYPNENYLCPVCGYSDLCKRW